MDETEWKKDETSYLIFQCSKCNQYSYVKSAQKSKKCPRCRRVHSVESIRGEAVSGMTSAVEMVKKKQNELAHKELGSDPDLRAHNDFTITGIQRKISTVEYEKSKKDEMDYSTEYLEMLKEISKTFKKFPLYVLELMAANYGIPASELKILTRNVIKQGILMRSRDCTFTVRIPDEV
ncbi:MAG: hypothetical protein ACXAEX_01480 [Promethearchaeota archaeon]|jgi:phage FluMu protein Com